MIRSLLVAYDGSHGARIALQHAVDFASRCEGRIALLTGSKGAEADADLPIDGGPDPVALAQEPIEPGEELPLPTESSTCRASRRSRRSSADSARSRPFSVTISSGVAGRTTVALVLAGSSTSRRNCDGCCFQATATRPWMES